MIVIGEQCDVSAGKSFILFPALIGEMKALLVEVILNNKKYL